MERISPDLITFVLNAAWQIPLVACSAWLTCKFLRNRPAQHRHAIWVASLVAGLLLPAAGIWKSHRDQPTFEVPNFASATGLVTGPLPSQVSPVREHPQPKSVSVERNVATVVLGLYLLSLIWGVTRLLRASIQTVRIRNSAHAAPIGDNEALWLRCMRAFRLTNVRLLASDASPGPLTAARDVIVPARFLAESEETVLVSALGHELAHIARRDFWLNIGYEVLALPIFFHPATSWIRRQIARTREVACDELVTQQLIAPRVYAESIVTIAGTIAGLPQPGCTMGVLYGDNLEERVERLTRPPANRKRARLALASAMSALALSMVAAGAFAISARAQSLARPELRNGVESFNSGDLAGAVDHFRKAVAMDPENLNARLYLAFALIREFAAQPMDKAAFDERTRVASGEGREDNPLLIEALQQYNEVLRRDPDNEGAIFGLSSIGGSAEAKHARAMMQSLIAQGHGGPNAYYALGTLDWRLAYPPITEAQKKAGIWPETYYIPDGNTRRELRDALMPTIDDGLKLLTTALKLQPQWTDAIAYLNLLDRAKAAIVDDPAESQKLVVEADALVHLALSERLNKPSVAITAAPLDVDGAPPLALPAPPPPPPPPPGWVRGEPAHPAQ